MAAPDRIDLDLSSVSAMEYPLTGPKIRHDWRRRDMTCSVPMVAVLPFLNPIWHTGVSSLIVCVLVRPSDSLDYPCPALWVRRSICFPFFWSTNVIVTHRAHRSRTQLSCSIRLLLWSRKMMLPSTKIFVRPRFGPRRTRTLAS
jgi:hypothetical protein